MSLANITDTEGFIAESRRVHGDRFTYGTTKYAAKWSPLEITCPHHGAFRIGPVTHIVSGTGCKSCPRHLPKPKAIKTVEQFVHKARLIFGDAYDYSKVVSLKEFKIKIICPTHGEFEQEAHSHVQGHGCHTCGETIRGLKKRSDQDAYLEKFRATHGDRYDYSKVVYDGNKKNVIIGCPDHGDFYQSPDAHARGQGCPECGAQSSIATRTKTTAEFIDKSMDVHGDKYDYSLVEYKGNDKRVVIICKTHGKFEQVPYSHHAGKGCPRCRTSKGELYIRDALTKLRLEFEEQKYLPGTRRRFDFYVPKFDLYIEFQGEQHFRPVEYFGGLDAFIKRVTSDLAKMRWCLENNYTIACVRSEADVDALMTHVYTDDVLAMKEFSLRTVALHLGALRDSYNAGNVDAALLPLGEIVRVATLGAQIAKDIVGTHN